MQGKTIRSNYMCSVLYKALKTSIEYDSCTLTYDINIVFINFLFGPFFPPFGLYDKYYNKINKHRVEHANISIVLNLAYLFLSININ